MLTKAEVNKIIKYLQGDGTLYELDEIESEAKCIVKRYIEIVNGSLTREEKEFIEMVKKDPERWNPVFDCCQWICLIFKDNDQVKSTIGYGNPEYYKYYNYDLVKNLGDDGRYVPNIFHVYNSPWTMFEEKFPEEWKNEIKPGLIRLNIFLNSYSNKVKLLEEILRYDGINSTLLKSKYPKLYTILKQ